MWLALRTDIPNCKAGRHVAEGGILIQVRFLFDKCLSVQIRQVGALFLFHRSESDKCEFQRV